MFKKYVCRINKSLHERIDGKEDYKNEGFRNLVPVVGLVGTYVPT